MVSARNKGVCQGRCPARPRTRVMNLKVAEEVVESHKVLVVMVVEDRILEKGGFNKKLSQPRNSTIATMPDDFFVGRRPLDCVETVPASCTDS